MASSSQEGESMEITGRLALKLSAIKETSVAVMGGTLKFVYPFNITYTAMEVKRYS
jgi:hypothetical protein